MVVVACEVVNKTADGSGRYGRSGLHLHNCSWAPSGINNGEISCGSGQDVTHFTGCSNSNPKGIIAANCAADPRHHWLLNLDEHSRLFDLICLNCHLDSNRDTKSTVHHKKEHLTEAICQDAFNAAHNISTESEITEKSEKQAPPTAPREAHPTMPKEEDGNKTHVNATVDAPSTGESPKVHDKIEGLKSSIADSIKGAQLNESVPNLTLLTWNADGLRSSAAQRTAPLSVAGACLLRHLSP
ncbi:hypothetical protein ERJ75_001213300 [Trypanosoma vivax]|nr:hypothetical protein ERJ75_001213300 [Trypanosoma vivax]